ncbi:ABC transporter substrate-binding protein [Bengtsoniella intestinalis]|uniref:ABC transporter substrate-binding protein n=1 Tax=Bengtsoniella intestinalis TaxID=3073143 RepID=UPI00391F5760
MKKLLAALLSVAMMASLVACSASESTATTESTVSGIQDTLTIGIASDINNLNPLAQNDQINNNCLALTHQTLVFLTNDTNEHVANIAQSWEWVSDNELVFHLVENATFSDGTPLTAEDVVFTYEMAIDPSQSSVSGSLGLVEAVSVVDAYTVSFQTTSYSNEILSVMAGYPTSIQSKAAYESGMESPWLIGSGRYVFEEWKEGQYVSFQLNENFWGDEPGVAQQIIFKPYLESSARVAALQSGEIDVCIDPPINELSFLEDDANVTVETRSGTRLFYFGFNTEAEPFDNETLRQAVACAINRDQIVQVILSGYGQTQTTIVNRGVWSFYDDMEGFDYDVERAKELLAEAGYAEGELTVELYASNGSPYKEIAPMIQEYLRQIGITVNIVSLDEATFKADAQAGAHQMFLWRWNVIDRLDEIYTDLFRTDSASNYHHFSDEYVDAMATAVLTEKDKDTREQLSIELQEYLVEACPQVPLYVADLVIAYNNGLQGTYLFGGGNHNWSTAYVEN